MSRWDRENVIQKWREVVGISIYNSTYSFLEQEVMQQKEVQQQASKKDTQLASVHVVCNLSSGTVVKCMIPSHCLVVLQSS